MRRFAADHLAAGAVASAHDEGFPRDVARLMAENGLFGIMLPEVDGGQGGSLTDALLAASGIARLDTFEALFEAEPLFARARPVPAPQRAVSGLTTTGGGAALVVDRLGLAGIACFRTPEAAAEMVAAAPI